MENDRLTVIDTKECVEKDCKKKFTITKGEEEHYKVNGLFLPKRCPMCRLKNRMKNKGNQSIQL